MVIVLTGGGTGGHAIPALALLPQLKKSFSQIVFIGGCGIEKKLAQAEGLQFFETASVGFSRSKIFKNFKIPFVLSKGILQAKKILKKLNPDIIFSKGGYVSLPTVIAGKLLNIPIVAHESDFSVGLANNIAVKLNATLLTSFPQTVSQNSDYIYTGFPLRQQLFKGDATKAKKLLSTNGGKQANNNNFSIDNSKSKQAFNSNEYFNNGKYKAFNGKKATFNNKPNFNYNKQSFDKNKPIYDESQQSTYNSNNKKFNFNKPVILIIGGSSGSQAINNAVLNALPTLEKTYTIVHLTGKGKKIDYKSPDYFSVEYVNNIEDFYALADIIISRAGAGAISELSALNKRTILIPLPKGNSRGDQQQNAQLAKEYGAIVLLQNDLSTTTLIKAIEQAKKSPMRPLSPVANEHISNILVAKAMKNRSIKTKNATN